MTNRNLSVKYHEPRPRGHCDPAWHGEGGSLPAVAGGTIGASVAALSWQRCSHEPMEIWRPCS